MKKKRKTVSGATALAVLTATIPVHASPALAEVKLDDNLDLDKSVEAKSSIDKVPDEFVVEGWATFETIEDLREYWNFVEKENSEGVQVILLQSYKGSSLNKKVEIPREIDGKPVELEKIGGAFNGVTHIKVAEGDGAKVKLHSTNLTEYSGIYNNGAIEYIDLSGLDATIQSAYQLFGYNSNLKYINLEGWKFTDNADLRYAFLQNSSLKYLNLSGWNIADGVNKSGMLHGVTLKYAIYNDMTLDMYKKLKSNITSDAIVELNNIDLAGYTSLQGLFEGFNGKEIRGLDTWIGTENITNLSNMFKNSRNLTNVEGLGGFNTTNVTNVSAIFQNCTSLESLSLDGWTLPSLTSLTYAFQNCHSLVTISGLENWNTSQVGDFIHVFDGCHSLTELNINSWNVSRSGNFQRMFRDCRSLTELDLSTWNMWNANWFGEMFKGTDSLKVINLTNSRVEAHWDTDRVFYTEEQKPLLVIVDNGDFRHLYNNNNIYAQHNRTPIITLDAGEGGVFQNGQATKNVGKYTVTSSEYNNAETIIKSWIDNAETPTKKGHTFLHWELVEGTDSEYNGFGATYRAVYEEKVYALGLEFEVEGEKLRKGNMLELRPYVAMSDGTRIDIKEAEAKLTTNGDIVEVEEYITDDSNSDNAVFHVDGLEIGLAELTLSYEKDDLNFTKTFTIDVFDYDLVNETEINLDLYGDKSNQLVVNAVYGDRNENVTSKTTFEVENPEIATVSPDGVLTGLKVGTTTIEVKPENEEEALETITVNVKDSTFEGDKTHLYLSSIGHDEDKSSVGWDVIKNDQNVESGTISLIVNGKATKFDKGVSAHATSNVVYNIEKFSNVYTRLITRVGIDSSKIGSECDGVYFVVEKSEDGEHWEAIEGTQTNTLKADSESVLIDVDITGAKYIKLRADKNGHDWSDHAVYGGLKLVKDGYVESIEERVFLDELKEVLETEDTKVENFKKLIKEFGVNVSEDTDNEVYERVIAEIETEVDSYGSLVVVEDLINRIKDEIVAEKEEAFYNKVKEVVTSESDTIEVKIQNFKELLTNEGESNVDDTSDDVYEATINEINADIESEGGNYTTLDEIKALIQRIKDEIASEDEEVKPDSEGWLIPTSLDELEQLWDYTTSGDTVILNSFKGVNTKSEDVKVEIPRVIDGYKVALANLNTATFEGVTHIRIADDGNEQIKLLTDDIHHGFRDNQTLKYVDLEGLNVSNVTSMEELFSLCHNLHYIKINDWVIKEGTSIMGMFAAGKDATEEQRKILVITNDYKINAYDFKASNRIPYTITFSGEGGHFYNDKQILNVWIENFTVRSEVVEDFKGLEEYFKSQVVDLIRDGYEFKGWISDATPTNIYELLDMTYKAVWEKVEYEGNGDDSTSQPPTEEDKGEEEKPNAPSTDIEDIIIDLESYEFKAPGHLEFTPKLKLKDGSVVTIPYDSNSMPEITLTSSNKEVIATLDKDDDERNTTVWIGSSAASNAEITLEYKGITKNLMFHHTTTN